jgi:hypothetical protein
VQRKKALVKFDCVVYQLNCEGECGVKSNLLVDATHAQEKRDVFLGARKSEWAPVAGSTAERPLGSPSPSPADFTSGARDFPQICIMKPSPSPSNESCLPAGIHSTAQCMVCIGISWGIYKNFHSFSFGAPQCASDGVRQKLHHQTGVAAARQLC